MAISDDLNSIRTHLEDDYKALEQLGVSVEDRNIENIKDIAQQIYDKFPKTSYAEGSNITLSNTLKGKLDFEDDIVGIGQTEQDSTKGYNIIDTSNFATTTINGVTCTNNGDGTFTINGTANATTQFNLINSNNAVNWSAGTYKLLGQPSGDSGWDKFIMFFNNWDGVNCYSGETKTLSNSTTSLTLTIRIGSGKTYNNLTFFPMITTNTSLTNDDCEKYTNGASPNPSYPQDIEVVRGKNRLDDSNLVLFNSNKYISTTNFSTQGKIAVKPNTTYTLAYKTSTLNDMGMWEFDSSNNKSTISYTPKGAGYYSIRIFTTLSTTKTMSFYAGSNDTYTIVEEFLQAKELMLLEGDYSSQAIPSYLPYNTLEARISNGNLAKAPTYIGYNVNSDGFGTSPNYSVSNKMYVNNNTIFYYGLLESLGNVTDNILRIGFFKADGTFISRTLQSNITASQLNSVNIPANTNYIMVGASNDTVNGFWKEIDKVCWGFSTDIKIPHQETTQQLSLGDYEFAKIGNYVDTIEYDVENDKVYKNEVINKYQFTGNENFGKAGSTNLNGYIFNFPSVTTNILPPANNGTKANILSNAFITKTVNTIISEATYGIGIRSDKYLYIGAPLGSFENVSALQTYLANNITFMYYTLITPVKQEITGTLKDQIKALYYSHSFTGTTIIEINGQLPLIIKVRALKGN